MPVFSLGTGTFGGTNDFFKRWGTTDVQGASHLIDIALDHGLNFFDTANVYSTGAAEEILGAALKGRRDKAIISTKAGFRMGDGANDTGASRHHILQQVDASLQRLGTDYIDVYFMHGFDAQTPLEETLRTLDTLVSSGKVRYIGASNYTAWQLMKSLSVSERLHLEKFIVYQGYYSIIGRDLEWDLLPLAKDQGTGIMAWSPLGWGRLTGKIRRNQAASEGRISAGGAAGGPEVDDAYLYNVIDVLDEIAAETGKTIAQISLNWLLTRDMVSNVVIGARNEQQLLDNLGALGWSLNSDQLERIDKVSAPKPIYPHWVGAR